MFAEGFEVAAKIRIKRALLEVERFDEEDLRKGIGHPSFAMEQPKLCRGSTDLRLEEKKLPAETPPIVGKIGVGPWNHDAIREKLLAVRAERWLRDDLNAAGRHDRQRP